ncbi:diguanylate cyclase domain-containing protein [Acidiphilium sp.]|uniref:GGDEF domain-containing protein n=1 Tax=Acidiphilium sp. TaxID=527 RepID=UPI003D07F38F
MSTLIYAFCLIGQWVAVWLHLSSASGATLVTTEAIVGEVGFYILIRSGFSTRFSEPTLNMPQMIYAILSLALAYVVNHHTQGMLLMIVALTLQYGSFTLSPRRCRQLGWFSVAVFVPIMAGAALIDPRQFSPVVEGFHIAFTIGVLPAIGFIAGVLSQSRIDLRRQRRALRDALERAEVVATSDELTGLPNRRYAVQWSRDIISRVERSGASLCFAIIDLDHFKRINDTRGHAIGDAVLQHFATETTNVLRAGTLFARWGGEEFVMVMPEISLAHAEATLCRLRGHFALAETWQIAGLDQITFSAGLTNHQIGQSIEETLRRADRALYEAKRQGRNCHVIMASCEA